MRNPLQAKYVLDADIEKCFDRIEHQELPAQGQRPVPRIRRQLKAWLKAGVIDQGNGSGPKAVRFKEPAVTAPGEYRDPRN